LYGVEYDGYFIAASVDHNSHVPAEVSTAISLVAGNRIAGCFLCAEYSQQSVSDNMFGMVQYITRHYHARACRGILLAGICSNTHGMVNAAGDKA
jgi:hypothetical protein